MDLNTEPRYGYYPWWPEDGNDWLHPDDVETARELIPSLRIFRREGEQGEFEVLYYGDQRIRVRPALWQEIQNEGFELGDWVEVLSRCGQNRPRTGTIRERLWDQRTRAIRYQIFDRGQPIAKGYAAEDLRHIDPTVEKLPH
jgi:hypothetical protein